VPVLEVRWGQALTAKSVLASGTGRYWHCEGLLIIDSGPAGLYKLGEAGEWNIHV